MKMGVSIGVVHFEPMFERCDKIIAGIAAVVYDRSRLR
jgi:hypothetical protein